MGERLNRLEHQVAELLDCIGRPPNPATGDPGAGMFRVVAELRGVSAASHRKTAGVATAGAAGMFAVFELLLELLKHWG